MKILILNEVRGMFANLKSWINLHTVHQCEQWGKLKPNCPMLDPDIIISLNNHITDWEVVQMGLTPPPTYKRVLYITHADLTRMGRSPMQDTRNRDWNDHFFCQFESDAVKRFKVLRFNPTTDTVAEESLYPGMGWLPLPLDSNLPLATVQTDKLVVGQAIGSEASASGYDKGIYQIRKSLLAAGVDYSPIYGLSHENAMTAMRGCNAIFDSTMGNIGMTGLEAMSMGVTALGRFHVDLYTQMEKLGANFPAYAFTDFEDLDLKIAQFKENRTPLVAMGASCRTWMQTNYSNKKIAQYWATELANL